MRLLRRLLEVQPRTSLLIGIPADMTMAMLERAALPSVDRLYLREVFAEGRRYAIERSVHGFRMTTTSKRFWQRGTTRTAETCRLDARVSSVEDGAQTAIMLIARLRWPSALASLWVPAGMLFVMWNMPWPRSVIVVILLSVLILALASVRLTCALEAAEMTFFIRKTFENVQKSIPLTLASANDSVIAGPEYDALWKRLQNSDTQGS
jgi:hypothetical protein